MKYIVFTIPDEVDTPAGKITLKDEALWDQLTDVMNAHADQYEVNMHGQAILKTLEEFQHMANITAPMTEELNDLEEN